jgi:hypothetical protein
VPPFGPLGQAALQLRAPGDLVVGVCVREQSTHISVVTNQPTPPSPVREEAMGRRKVAPGLLGCTVVVLAALVSPADAGDCYGTQVDYWTTDCPGLLGLCTLEVSVCAAAGTCMHAFGSLTAPKGHQPPVSLPSPPLADMIWCGRMHVVDACVRVSE